MAFPGEGAAAASCLPSFARERRHLAGCGFWNEALANLWLAQASFFVQAYQSLIKLPISQFPVLTVAELAEYHDMKLM